MKNKRVLIPVLALLVVAGGVLTSCQNSTPVTPAQITSLTETSNQLTNFGDPNVKRLADKLHHSDTELTHILVAGDSHTAADFLSGQLRTMFQRRYGDGGPGFISPLAIPGNRYSNVGYSSATGWRLESSRRTINSEFTLGGNIATPVTDNNLVRISATDGETELRAQALYLALDNASLWLQHQPVPLIQTQGHWALSPAVSVPSSFSLSLSGKAQLGGVWLTARQPHGVIVSALGSNGAQISMLNKWPADWPGTLRMLSPDMVVLAYGTNEAFNASLSADIYRQELTIQIRKIRQAVPDAVILLIGPGSSIQHKDGTRCLQRQSAALTMVIQIQKQVAETEHTLFWDWFSFMGGACSIDHWVKEGKARPDLVHLQAEGYREVADGMWKNLMAILEG